MPQIPTIIQTPTERPLVKVVNHHIDNPAAGAAFTYTVPVGYRTRLVSLFMRLITDANVADRFVVFTIASPAGIIFQLTHTTGLTASDLGTFQFHNGSHLFQLTGTNPNHSAPFPAEITLEEGDEIQITVTSIQVGDQIDLIHLHLLSQFVAE